MSELTVERRDARENRQRILAAARDEFARHGEATEMKDIAARAGVGIGTLYRRFGSRDDLVTEIIRETLDELVAGARAAVAGLPPAEALRAIIIAALETHARFGALAQMALQADPARFGPGMEAFNQIMADLVARGAAAGEFRSDVDVRTLTAMLRGLFKSGEAIALAEERGPQRAATDVVDLLVRGCLAVRP